MSEVVIGIDIGGTNTVYGFVNKNGECLFDGAISTNAKDSAENLFERLFSKIRTDMSSNNAFTNLIGIGIGAPNANYYRGTVEQPPNLNWGTVNVIEIVKKYFDVPVAITNDANAAAIGEMQFGAAKEYKDFIVITLGTGLGSGIVSNGKLIYGHDGFAGEIGHVCVIPNGRECGCGRKGCLETYASASGIKRTVFELLANSNLPSLLRDTSFNDLSSKLIFEAASNDDEIAKKAFEYTGAILGKALADAVHYTSPKAIILFGGLAAAGEFIFAPTKKSFEESLLNIFKNKIEILPSALTEGNAAVLGAAALILNELDIVPQTTKEVAQWDLM
ncbi:MAG: ROK family protein [Ignavibacteriaceae bacterium]|nr:ROK family protein [Ignavibacteriaceae bacterium]